jgi:hypothetical protein
MENRVLDAINRLRADPVGLARKDEALMHPPDCDETQSAVDFALEAKNAGLLNDDEAALIVGAFDDCDYKVGTDKATMGGINAVINAIGSLVGG